LTDQRSDQTLPAGQRIAALVEYDGSSFSGWQLQANGTVSTVQGALEEALGKVAAGNPVRVNCAGRTDSGVHATAQMVHFDAPVARSPKAWLMGANANLPASVVVVHAQPVPQDFHARFSALSRRYRYLIYNRSSRSSVAASKVCWVRQKLDETAMHTAAQSLLGEQDFSAFRAAACQSSTPMRRVDTVAVVRRGDLIVVDIKANAFLHHMVRNIVGTLIAIGRGRAATNWVKELLAARDRTLAADTASAAGLYLVGVAYPAHFELPLLPPGPLGMA
jgi:tRNA pseudouridine38-40 synthase